MDNQLAHFKQYCFLSFCFVFFLYKFLLARKRLGWGGWDMGGSISKSDFHGILFSLIWGISCFNVGSEGRLNIVYFNRGSFKACVKTDFCRGWSTHGWRKTTAGELLRKCWAPVCYQVTVLDPAVWDKSKMFWDKHFWGCSHDFIIPTLVSFGSLLFVFLFPSLLIQSLLYLYTINTESEKGQN